MHFETDWDALIDLAHSDRGVQWARWPALISLRQCYMDGETNIKIAQSSQRSNPELSTSAFSWATLRLQARDFN